MLCPVCLSWQEHFGNAHWDRFPRTEDLKPFFSDASFMGSQQFTVHREAPVDLRSWFYDEPGPAWFVHAFRVCMVAVCLEEDRASREMGLRCPAPSHSVAEGWQCGWVWAQLRNHRP